MLARRDFLLMITGSTVATTTAGWSRNASVHRLQRSDTFFIQQIGAVPDGQDWSLCIDGLVDNSLMLSVEDLQELPRVESMRTLMCIGNPVGGDLIGNAVWSGFDFSSLLNRVRVQSTARQARFYARDGYSTAVELVWLEQPGVILADRMNGEPLLSEHGYPLRLLIPGLYGQKQPKWIERIEFIDYVYKGYWESRGWSDVAENQTIAIIHSPRHRQVVGGTVEVQGVAFAGLRNIRRVEVRVDGGEWMPTTLVRGKSPLAWTQWHVTWTPPFPGTYTIEVRAIDDRGETPQYEKPKPYGATMPHRLVVFYA